MEPNGANVVPKGAKVVQKPGPTWGQEKKQKHASIPSCFALYFEGGAAGRVANCEPLLARRTARSV